MSVECIFFFKQKTAYEMRISDWSSDVCSSDLNAIGYLLNRAGYHGHHVPHGLRAAFSTIMNEWAERQGKKGDRQVIDLMLAHVPKAKVEGAYNRAAYMSRRSEFARLWSACLIARLPAPAFAPPRSATETRKRPT